jgi:hypothetical protein
MRHQPPKLSPGMWRRGEGIDVFSTNIPTQLMSCPPQAMPVGLDVTVPVPAPQRHRQQGRWR